jgi:hypothetical protein
MKNFLCAVMVAMTLCCLVSAQETPDLNDLARLSGEGIGIGTQVVAPFSAFVQKITVTGQIQGKPFGKAKFEAVFSSIFEGPAGPLVPVPGPSFEVAASGFCGRGTGSLTLTSDDRSSDDHSSWDQRSGTIVAKLLGSSCNSATFTTSPFSVIAAGPTGLNVTYQITGGTGRFKDAKGGGHFDVTITSITTGSPAYAHLDGNIVCEACNREFEQKH